MNSFICEFKYNSYICMVFILCFFFCWFAKVLKLPKLLITKAREHHEE